MKVLQKKIGAVMLAITLTAGGLCGCENSGKQSAVKEMSFYSVATLSVYSPELPIWKEAEKRTGIRLVNTVADSVTNEEAAFGTMLTAKQKPDVVLSTNRNLRSLALDGGLLALDEYIREYAPNLKNFFENCPEARAIATGEDGHIYFIPGTTTDVNCPDTPSSGFYIRKDWLSALGLAVPTTIDELHAVLTAFRTQDPNGNGIADEIPFFSRERSIGGLLNLFCSGKEWVVRDGHAIYVPAEEEYRTAMRTLAQWYQEGLIDKEIYTRNSVREQLLGGNLGGCTVDWFSSTGKFDESYADLVPGIEFASMLPPKNINGELKWPYTRGVMHGRGWGLSADIAEEDIVDAVKYLDFWMSEEGRELMAYGVEGVSYTRSEDGKVVWSEEAKNHPDGIPNYRRTIGFMECGTEGMIEAEKAGMNETALSGYLMYENIVEENGVGDLPYTADEQKISDQYGDAIRAYVAEIQQRWLFGEGDVDAEWEQYRSDMEEMGLSLMQQAVENAYLRKMEFIHAAQE